MATRLFSKVMLFSLAGSFFFCFPSFCFAPQSQALEELSASQTMQFSTKKCSRVSLDKKVEISTALNIGRPVSAFALPLNKTLRLYVHRGGPPRLDMVECE